MAEPVQAALLGGVSPGLDQPAGYPFRGPGLVARVVPFAAIAIVAEASLALPPGPTSTWPVVVSVVLLLAVAASFLLPWSRLPAWMTVLVPLAYTGSVLSLILAAGPTSGVGVVLLIPLIWTALFHRRWESGCIVAAIVAVEVIISLTPVAAADAVIARRVILWASLGTVISIATHGLRDRIRRSQEEAARAQEDLRELTVLEDRDRVAADLQDKVIQRVFATGLALQGATPRIADPEARRRVEASVDDLDHVLRILRDTIFGLDQHLQHQGFRREITELCDQLSPAPALSFSGPVDGALHPAVETQLVEILREALALIGQHATPSRIGVVAEDSWHVTVIEAGLLPHAVKTDGPVGMFASLQDSAARAGIRADIEPVPDGIRFVWHVPMNPAAAEPPNAPIRPARRSEVT